MMSRSTLACEKRTASPEKQRGAVLVFALIALITIMLAAVALVRSVDTSTIIAGNIAFKQAATSSADSGVEAAATWISQTYKTALQLNPNSNPLTDASHPFNNDTPASGYYTSMSTALNLMSDATWTAGASVDVGTDSSGNAIQYIIQRMCRQPNQLVSDTNCLFGSNSGNTNDHTASCDGYPGCLGRAQARSPLYRVTVRVRGPKNTTSFVQTFVQLN